MFFMTLCELFSRITETFPDDDEVMTSITFINPATGLPMAGSGTYGVDVGGSPFGVDIHASSSCDDYDAWD